MHICIIGAGVVGTTTAWALAQQGHSVTLLESREAPGLETSFANAGQLSYSYVAPLAEPSVLPNLPKWLLDRNSPLQFKPQLDPRQWCWGAAFLRACRSSVARQTTAQMLSLSYLSRDTLAAWMAETPVPFAHRVAGKLIVYRSAALLEKARALVQQQARHGASQQILTPEQCLQHEPALRSFGSLLAGAVYTQDEAVGDCHQLTQELADRLPTFPGATLRTGAVVASLERSQGRITAARLQDGERIAADHFVLANAIGSRDLLRPLGDDVPLYGLKGYSLSLPLSDAGEDVPHISVTDYERRIVYARIGDQLRIAAMVDMGDTSTTPDPARVAQLKAQVREVFPALPLENAIAWAGLRPSTPDSKPRIGRSRAAGNLWLNLGHGALGFTLACGSAVLLRALIAGEPAPIDPQPFAP